MLESKFLFTRSLFSVLTSLVKRVLSCTLATNAANVMIVFGVSMATAHGPRSTLWHFLSDIALIHMLPFLPTFVIMLPHGNYMH